MERNNKHKKACKKCNINTSEKEEKSFNNIKEISFILLSGLLLLIGILSEKILHKDNLYILEYIIYISAYLIAGFNVLIKAGKNILKRDFFDENFLMSVATLGAIAIHELPEAVAVMLFFKIGEFFQELSLNRSRRSIRKILEIKPRYANLKKDRKIERILPEHVNPGDIIIVRPGEKVPLDGVILKGESYVDTSPITGESVPRFLKKGDSILAGVINKNGLLEIEVKKPFNESSINKILKLIEEAKERKARAEKFITKFAKYYTPFILLLALSIAVFPPLFIEGAKFYDWIYRALVLLVISCPCALVISIPLSYFGGIGASSKNGILVKGSNYLDMLNSIDIFVFDKTGTLTKGTFKVKEVVALNGFKEEEIIEISAFAEYHSNHPIAVSIKEYYGKKIKGVKIENFREKEGFGVFAKINGKNVMVGSDRMLHENNIEHNLCKGEGTTVHVVIGNLYAGYIVISDEIRDDAKKMVEEIKKLGVKRVGMLTGDEKFPAKIVAEKIGIDFYKAELLPHEKVREIEELKQKGKVAFVGDGINDAAACARADVGIAMGAMGQDAAIESSDIVIMDDSLFRIPKAIKIARKTRRIVWQNIIFAISVKLFFVIAGSFGVATMWEAVFADMGVALIAIFNAMRILRTRNT